MDRLRALGVEGVPALLERLPAAEDPQRAAILRFLSWSVYDWRDDAVGPAVCRALLPVIGTAEDELGYVADALARGAPASRAVVHDLAEMWTRGTPRVSDAAEDVLWRLGPDAAPVAPLALAAMLDSIPSSPTEDPDSDDGTRSSSRFARALSLLTATGADDPEVVAALRRLLAPGANQFARVRVADVFRTWNDKAAAAVPDLLAMLHEHVWTEAAHGTASRHAALAALVALCAMPSADEVVWEEVQRAFRRGDAWTRNWDAVATLAGNPALEDRLAALATSLPPEAGGPILCRLFESCAHTQVALTPAMVRYPVAWARHGALRAWIDPDEMRPLPACTAELLDDEDAPVRARAALVLTIHGGASAESIRDAALSVVRPVTDAAGTYWWGDAEACGEAISTLGLLADRDPAALEWFVSDLESDRPLCSLRHAASVLARTGDALDGDHPKALARLHDGLLADPERAEVASIVGAMLRLGGGAEALAEACEQRLKSRTTLGALRAWAFGIARRAGPRAAVLRPVLLRMRAGAEAGEASEIDGALASIEEDPEGIARTWDAREPAVRRLIALGPAGRRALVLLVGRASRIDDVLPLLEGVPMEEAVRAVVRATSPGPTLDLRRLGAVRLAYRLPAAEALAIWTETLDASRAMVPGYARESLRADVHQSSTTLEMRAPGSLPVEFVRTLLDGDPPAPLACRLAGLLGPSAADLVPALRKVRDGDRWGPALSASVALWRITRSADEALASIDRVLPGVRYGLTVGDEGFWDVQDEDAWAEIASTFAEMPPDRRLLDTLLGVLRRPVNAEGAIVPLLEPFGADAAPAVPALRRMLFTHYADENHYAPECDLPAVRALGTIGPAARDALPDLRRWLTEHRRDRRRARAAYEAIRRIEAAPK